MTAEPGPLLASGREADVYDQLDGTVLRRYRRVHDTELEGQVMSWLHDQGLPVPAVHSAGGHDIVMDRVDGPTMLESLSAKPWTFAAHARTLASLQRRINGLVAPEWFPRRDGVPHGGVAVHLDLHPMNVMYSPAGPVVIDWTNASVGSAAFDAAMTYIVMASFEVDSMRDRLGQRALVGAFALARGRRLVRDGLADAVEHRLTDRNVTPGERVALERLRP